MLIGLESRAITAPTFSRLHVPLFAAVWAISINISSRVNLSWLAFDTVDFKEFGVEFFIGVASESKRVTGTAHDDDALDDDAKDSNNFKKYGLVIDKPAE